MRKDTDTFQLMSQRCTPQKKLYIYLCMSLLNLSRNPSSTFLKSFLFRTYWFILLPQSREPGNKLHPFTQDIKTEINTHIPHLQTCHKCPIKKRFNTEASRGFNWTSLPSFHANTLDTLQHNWFLCLSERVVNYPLSVRHKKRLQRKIRSRLEIWMVLYRHL